MTRSLIFLKSWRQSSKKEPYLYSKQVYIYIETLKNYCKVSHTTTIDFMIGVPIYWNWLTESVYASVEGRETYAIIYGTFVEKCDIHIIHDAEEKPIYIYRLPRLVFIQKSTAKIKSFFMFLFHFLGLKTMSVQHILFLSGNFCTIE